MRSFYMRTTAFIAVVGGGLMAVPVMAQDTKSESTATPAPAAESNDVGDIIVTAQRRSESLNKVGLSVVALSGEQLSAKGVNSTADLVKVVPSLTYTETPYGTGVLTLRGIGFFESSMAASSPVATYLDEIPIPYPRMAAGAQLDLQRVEVLKGPQGTLYGQNTTGGLVNYVAAKPTDYFTAGMTASVGRFWDTNVQGYVSGPLSDTLSARLSAGTHQGDGWQISATRPNDRLGASRMTNGRLLLEWKPSSRLTLLLNANGFIDKSDTQAFQAIAFTPGVPTSVQPQELTAPLIPPGSNRIADWDPDKKFRRDNSYYQFSLKSRYDLGNAEIISITAYQKYKQDQLIDSDGTYLEVAGVTQSGYISSLSQELRLQGESGSIKYVVGGNYSDDRILDKTIYMVHDSSLGLAVPAFPISRAVSTSYQSAKTWAIFGGLDLRVLDIVTLQGSVRYTSQRRNFTGCIADNGDGEWAALFGAAYGTTFAPGACTTSNPTTGAFGPVSDKLNEDNVAWRVNVNVQPNNDVLLYAGVSRGYKAGSFPNVGGVVSVQYVPAKQESVLAYEAGAKLTLADRKLQLNGSFFYYDYSDKQFRGKILDSFFGSIDRLYNVPRSRVMGAEIQVMANPVRGLQIDGGASWQNSKIQSNFAGLTPIGTPANLQGETFEYTPKLSATGGFTYESSIREKLTGYFGLSSTYQSRTHGGYGGLPLFKIAAYALVDGRIGIRAPDSRWSAELWVRNMFDKYYVTNVNYSGDFTYRITGRPRTFGITLGYKIR